MTEKNPPEETAPQEGSQEKLKDGLLGTRQAYIINNKKPEVSPEQQEKLDALTEEIKREASIPQASALDKAISGREYGTEPFTIEVETPSSHNIKNNRPLRKLRDTFVSALALFGTFSAANAKAPENTKDKELGATVRTVSGQNSVKNESDSTIAVYTKAKTEKGGITPTGLSNSFLENEYGVTPADIDSIAHEHGFSTRDEASFQKDLIEYAHSNDPEIVQYVLEHFGQTEYGLKNKMAPNDYKQLLDGLLGVRAAYIIKFYKEVPNEKEVDPYANFAQHGEVILTQGAGGRAVGQLFYKTRETSDVKDAGNTETSKVKSIFRHMDKDGHFTGAVTELTESEHTEVFKGTRHIQNPDLFSKIEKKLSKN